MMQPWHFMNICSAMTYWRSLKIMGSLFHDISMAEFLSPIWLSLKVAFFAGIIVIILGTAAGRLLARRYFKGKAVLETVLMLPMVLPPTVVGFVLIIVFGRNSIVG